jgi:hypothetical protein
MSQGLLEFNIHEGTDLKDVVSNLVNMKLIN